MTGFDPRAVIRASLRGGDVTEAEDMMARTTPQPAGTALPGTVPVHIKPGRRVVATHLDQETRLLLDAAMADQGVSRPQAVLAALAATHDDIVREAEAAAKAAATNPFVARPRRRTGLVNPKEIMLYMPDSAAASLARMRERTGMSVSAIITEAVRRYYGPVYGPSKPPAKRPTQAAAAGRPVRKKARR